MKTLVVSDLHVGPDSVSPIYAGDTALPALIERLAPPLCLVFNGDTFDLLLDDAPLVLNVARSIDSLEACARSSGGALLVRAIARVLQEGGEVLVRAGNHDVELAIPEVQSALGAILSRAGAPIERLAFSSGDLPFLLEVGGRRVLITHGEHADPFNQWRHANVRDAVTEPGRFDYPPGSVLVKEVLNPLKAEMPFLDLLKPDFQGAVLTALAVRPWATRRLLRPATLQILAGVIDNLVLGTTFTGETDTPEVVSGWNRLVIGAGADPDELRELSKLLHTPLDAVVTFGEDSILSRALERLARSALRAYATVHRCVTGTAGRAFFSEEPSDDEWQDAQRIAKEFQADVVIAGHTHARRLRRTSSLTYINTGTWIWLMRLPDPDAPIEEWATFLQDLRDDPSGSTHRVLLGTGCLIDENAEDLVQLCIATP